MKPQVARQSLFRGARGFTMVELVMVIVLVGVLAVFVMPRLNNVDFKARGFHDETLSLLRYAQKSAIAQRRTVCVGFSVDSMTLNMAAAGATGCPGGVVMTGPRGESPARVKASSGVAYVTQPTDFSFNGLGQPSVPQSLQVAGAGVATGQIITVEAATGYVHD
ncbi:MAG: prepilin-type N-terminal cleavage/methylation domain-containing protein [Hylemonella sp.]|nr:prepilin-type N-terminal cleavage/methylation domain-containing protein [Hylemonella sp.]MDH5709318.1 prepilin-type N-terminal cleavage/methylation domain-containing protein [Hylemonella sp.]